jgi:hypothetical protein
LALRDKTISINHDDVLHILNTHGTDSEAVRGQVPITPDDISNFGNIFNAAKLDLGTLGKSGETTVQCVAEVDGFTYRFAVVVRKTRIDLKTLFKRKA